MPHRVILNAISTTMTSTWYVVVLFFCVFLFDSFHVHRCWNKPPNQNFFISILTFFSFVYLKGRCTLINIPQILNALELAHQLNFIHSPEQIKTKTVFKTGAQNKYKYRFKQFIKTNQANIGSISYAVKINPFHEQVWFSLSQIENRITVGVSHILVTCSSVKLKNFYFVTFYVMHKAFLF